MRRQSWIGHALWLFPALLIGLGIAWTVYLLKNPEQKDDSRERMGWKTPPPTDSAELRRFAEALVKDIGRRSLENPQNIVTTTHFIESTLGPLNTGYEVLRHDFEVNGVACTNITAERTGTRRPNDVVIVSTRFDAEPGSPGAQDGASGLAVWLALARAFVKTKPEITLRFCAFAPESGNLAADKRGSTVYAKLCAWKKENVQAVLHLDSLGVFERKPDAKPIPPDSAPLFPATGDFIAFVGGPTDSDLVNALAPVFSQRSGVPVHRVLLDGDHFLGRSADSGFREIGFRAVRATDMGAYRSGVFGGPYDELDRLDFEKMAELTGGLEAVIRSLIAN